MTGSNRRNGVKGNDEAGTEELLLLL